MILNFFEENLERYKNYINVIEKKNISDKKRNFEETY